MSFGESVSTLPATLNEFRQVFAAADSTYSFDSYADLSASADKRVSIHYSFRLMLDPAIDAAADSPPNSMLPLTMLRSDGFSKYTATLENLMGNVIDERSADEIEAAPDAPQDAVIPKTFAFTLTLLDCSFNKRPFTGIWQLRFAHFDRFEYNHLSINIRHIASNRTACSIRPPTPR